MNPPDLTDQLFPGDLPSIRRNLKMLSLNGVDSVVDALVDESGAGTHACDRASQGMPTMDLRKLVRDLKVYRDPQLSRSLWELACTIVPLIVLFGLMLGGINKGNFFALVLAVPTGLFLLRLFLIQHDCGHGSFLPSRPANDWLGRFLGVLTLTPYDCWRRSHALHHANTGNLDARGFGDVDTLTVREFHALTHWRQFGYRLYRHPLVLFGFGPAYLFLIRHRLPIGLMKAGSVYWLSAMGTNAATAIVAITVGQWVGIAVFGLALTLVVLTAASLGVWLFYTQHQFEEAHWDRGNAWTFHEAALHGSSHLALPPMLRWFSANIGVHHVHHLVSRIPFYRLPEVLRAYPDLASVNRLTPLQTFRTLRLALWDETRRRMVPFPRSSEPCSDAVA